MSKKVKNANIEWLRIISMFMVVILHELGKGNLLRVIFTENGVKANTVIAWVLESLAVVAVNVFFLISGYLLIDSEFKTKRIFSLIMEMVFYGGLVFFVYSIAYKLQQVEGKYEFLKSLELTPREEGNYEFLQSFLPVHMDIYWFMTVYLFMYIALPFVSKGIKLMNKKQHLTVIILWLVIESGFKSILPVKLEMDRSGYNLQWFIVMFLIAAYVKKYGFGILNKAYKGLIAYFVGVLLVFGEQVFLDYMLATKVKFTYIQQISYSYNHVFVLLASLGLFAWGINCKQPGKVVSKIAEGLAPFSLGVYLLHEHMLIRYQWPRWFKVTSFANKNAAMFILSVLGVALLVYAVGTVVDIVRSLIFKGIDAAFRKTPVTKLFNRMDDLVNGRVD